MPVRDVAGRPLRFQPLWARVDANRAKLAWFVGLFVLGSALVLTVAMAIVPGVLIGGAAVLLGLSSAEQSVLWVLGIAAFVFAFTLVIAAVVASVQLGNAEDWVRSRFKGRTVEPAEQPELETALADMAIAAGLSERPELVVVPSEPDAVNAYVLGSARSRAVIGVTEGFLHDLTEEEQRAVVAVLVARVVAGDILTATAVAGLMGPIAAVRKAKTGEDAGQVAGCAARGLMEAWGDHTPGGTGCLVVAAVALFMAFVIFTTWLAVKLAAWLVSVWSRALDRAGYQKADAEGMLLLRDPAPMLSALRKVITSSNVVGSGDPSYDGIFYSATSGTRRVEKWERRRFERLAEVLGVEGAAVTLDEEGSA